jgi:uncharacterized protein YjbI with pentapeptide repeats
MRALAVVLFNQPKSCLQWKTSDEKDSAANLSRAVLVGARIYSGDLDGAVLQGADLRDLEILPDVGAPKDG